MQPDIVWEWNIRTITTSINIPLNNTDELNTATNTKENVIKPKKLNENSYSSKLHTIIILKGLDHQNNITCY